MSSWLLPRLPEWPTIFHGHLFSIKRHRKTSSWQISEKMGVVTTFNNKRASYYELKISYELKIFFYLVKTNFSSGMWYTIKETGHHQQQDQGTRDRWSWRLKKKQNKSLIMFPPLDRPLWAASKVNMTKKTEAPYFEPLWTPFMGAITCWLHHSSPPVRTDTDPCAKEGGEVWKIWRM